MAARRPDQPIAHGVVRLRVALQAAVFLIAAAVVAWSAIVVKEARHATPLLAIDRVAALTPQPTDADASPDSTTGTVSNAAPGRGVRADTEVRWFNGRPVRPARTLWMTVTAYSPDHRSCGIFADGKTSTLHSVWTNGMRLVAADTRLLPFGSLLTVPGYAGGDIVPVLDRGGAIKGHRLDVLFPSHSAARQWGVRKIPVVVWEYADGLPPPNPRRERQ